MNIQEFKALCQSIEPADTLFWTKVENQIEEQKILGTKYRPIIKYKHGEKKKYICPNCKSELKHKEKFKDAWYVLLYCDNCNYKYVEVR